MVSQGGLKDSHVSTWAMPKDRVTLCTRFVHHPGTTLVRNVGIYERDYIKTPFSLLTPSKTRKDKKKKKERKANQAGDNRNRLAHRGSFLYLPDSWLMGSAKEGSGACVPALGSSLLPSKVCKKHA